MRYQTVNDNVLKTEAYIKLTDVISKSKSVLKGNAQSLVENIENSPQQHWFIVILQIVAIAHVTHSINGDYQTDVLLFIRTNIFKSKTVPFDRQSNLILSLNE